MAFLLAVAMLSCGKDRWPEYYPQVYKSMWVDSVLRASYLYRADLPDESTLTSSYFLEPQAFLKKVLPSYDTFSRVDSINGGKVLDQGLRFNWIPLEGGLSSALIHMVEEGSVAQECGIIRGDWVLRIDGDSITANEKGLLTDGGAHELLLARSDSLGMLTPYRTVSLPAARTYKKSSLQAIDRLEVGSHDVAYICLTSLDAKGVAQIEDLGYRLNLDNCDYLVMDLRYANSGDLESMRLVSGMVCSRFRACAPLAVLHSLGARGVDTTTINYPSPEEMGLLPYMNLKGVYFLVSGETQAEAEILINCLRPHIPTTIIGLSTKGLAVTLGSFPRNDIGLELRPVTAHVANYMGEATYEGVGLEPELRVSEMEHLDLILPFGDKDEALLSEALKLIRIL